jgi:DNA-binding response OmpR family regulator
MIGAALTIEERGTLGSGPTRGGPGEIAQLRARCARLAETLQERDEEIRRLRQEIPMIAILRARLGLTPMQGEILGALIARPRGVAREALMAALYGLSDDAPSDRVLIVYMSQIRARLRPHGIAGGGIDCVKLIGWRLTDEARRRIGEIARGIER